MNVPNENAELGLQKAFDDAIERHLYQYYWKSLGLHDWKIRVENRRNEVPFSKAILETFQDLAGVSLKGKKMLDVGCGWGGYVAAASEMGADICGCDIDADVIEVAKLRTCLHGSDSKYFCCPAEELPFSNEEFECVLNWGVLEHVRDVSRTVKEIVRVLKKGGVGFIYAPNYWQPMEYHYKVLFPPKCPKALGKLYLRMLGRPTAFLDTINYIDHAQIKNEFEKCGVVIEDVERKFWSNFRRFYVPRRKSLLAGSSPPWTCRRVLSKATEMFASGIVRLGEVTLNIRQICFVIRKPF
jgi:2-polyprenyl-3-methyl-5-hydroxy-6-metoxy-1,4-benzoquinol methylase